MALTSAQAKEFMALSSQLSEMQRRFSRFERQLFPKGTLDRVTDADTKAKKALIAATKKKKKDRFLNGLIKRDPQFQAELAFSDDGTSYSNSFVNPKANTIYWVRMRLAQHQVEPLLQGFKLQWILPTGWVWQDAEGSISFEEAISNPLVITRKVKSPSTVAVNAKFRVIILKRYFMV